MAFRVGEHRDRHPGELGHEHDRLSAELFSLVQRRLWIVGLDVERDVAVAIRGLADAAGDPLALLFDHGVGHAARDLLRLPSEELGVEALQLVEVLPRDLEVNDWVCHCSCSSRYIDGGSVTQGSGPGFPPTAAISRRGR